MVKEIGSEFWSVPVDTKPNNYFSKGTEWFISGTAALEFIIKDVLLGRAVKTAAVPSWCCSCLISPFIKQNIDVSFYPVYVDEDGSLVCDFSFVQNCDLTLTILYFGYEYQKKIGEPQGIIIEDVTHSVFIERESQADYFFGSLRKWAGFYTGGYAWTKKEWSVDIKKPEVPPIFLMHRKKAMYKKEQYISGKTDKKTYLDDFEIAEEFLDSCGILSADTEDIVRANYLDLCFIRNRRRENASILLRELKDRAIFPFIEQNDCPMFVPIILPENERDSLQKYLISKKIYCPVHWPITKYHVLDEKTSFLYHHELSIVCDQRYNTEDMNRILYEIHHFFT